jgi:hypothetical protein
MEINITLPPGRLVRGSLYKPTTTDMQGNPLVVKNGQNAGQPREDWYCEIAISKAGEQHWAHTTWGKDLYQVGATDFPQAVQRQDFAWKVIDGDSTAMNQGNKVYRDIPGYAGCWVVRLSSGYKSPLFTGQAGAWVQQPQEDFVKLGDFIQAAVTIKGNGQAQKPGVYINHSMFAFIGYGQRIVSGPDANSAGFGQAPLPPGVMATPPAGAPMPAAPSTPPIPGMPPAPGAPAPIMPPPAAPAPAAPPLPAAAPADPLVGVPGAAHTVASLRAAGWTDDQIVAGGHATRAAAPVPAPLPPGISAPAPAAPVAPAAPAAPVMPNPAFAQIPAAPQLTPAGVAAGGTYDAFRAQGWQDDQLRAQGYMA